MNKTEFTSLLIELHACDPALDWIENQPTADVKELIEACTHTDWLFWLVNKCNFSRQRIVFAATQCARLVLPYTTDPRIEACIEACEKWSRGEISDEDLIKARDAAYAAYATYATYVAVAAVADATYVAAYAAYAAAHAAYDAAGAEYAATYAEYVARQKCCDLILKEFTAEEIITALKEI